MNARPAEKKIRYSRQRERIYDYLMSSREHPSAEMIYDDLREEISNLSLGTVYRNLKLLEEMGKVQRITTVQNAERYDARCDIHSHFVCEECGAVKDLAAVDLDKAKELCNIGNELYIESASILFEGLCDKCKKG